MRKATLLLLAATTASLSTLAQPSRWFVSVSSGIPFGGPVHSIKNHMIKSGLDQKSTFVFFLLPFSTGYPMTLQNPPLLLKLGKRITSKRSLFLIAGLSGTGEAEGYKDIDYAVDMNPFFSGSRGLYMNVKYKLFQAGAGYQYSYPNTRSTVAMAPSVFIFKYENTRGTEGQRHTAVGPGIAFSGRVPLGKEKRLFGVDLVAELNLAPPIKMKALSTEKAFDNKMFKVVLESNSVNMVHGMIGLACSFRRK